MNRQCWCGREYHEDLVDGCVGVPMLISMFAPPDLNAIIHKAFSLYGDLIAMSFSKDAKVRQKAQDTMAANPPPPPPTPAQDLHMLAMFGMEITAEDLGSIKEWASAAVSE